MNFEGKTLDESLTRYLSDNSEKVSICGMSPAEVYMMREELEAVRGKKPMMSLSTFEEILIRLGCDPEMVIKDWVRGKTEGKIVTVKL